MNARPAVPGPSVDTGPSLDGAFRLVVLGVVVLLAVMGFSVLRGALPSGPGSSAEPSSSGGAADLAAFLVPDPAAAPELGLVDQSGAPLEVEDLRGAPALVFFGYTHCPDVCPATMGTLAKVVEAHGPGLAVVFVSVDPERDTVEWLAEYARYLPDGYRTLTGTPAEIRAAADRWGVRYARVETGTPGEYSMSHTADVFLVDGAGVLRATFPFGTQAGPILETLALVEGSTPTPGVATPTPTAATTATPEPSTVPDLAIDIVSSSIWARGASPVIFGLRGPEGQLAADAGTVTVQVRDPAGNPVGPEVRANAVQPTGVEDTSFVAFVDLPTPGWWRLAVEARAPGGPVRTGSISVPALDPGATAPLGAPAPTIATPTLDDVDGEAVRITTDPLPELRLSRTSTAEALAAGEPFVLVVDSVRFKVTPACGKAVSLAKYLVNRWPDVPFIHLEPYAYDVVTTEPVIRGSLSTPSLVEAADAWGVGGAPWGVGSMPWVFIVDGDGTVVAKYQGVVGSADIDVIVSLLAGD
ncbi:MAG TPA: SCO family protein [Candidatus Limnocylindrales bacterium]|nr:SCO family protein [Candidatus Limnocylindrales bacterium]